MGHVNNCRIITEIIMGLQTLTNMRAKIDFEKSTLHLPRDIFAVKSEPKQELPPVQASNSVSLPRSFFVKKGDVTHFKYVVDCPDNTETLVKIKAHANITPLEYITAVYDGNINIHLENNTSSHIIIPCDTVIATYSSVNQTANFTSHVLTVHATLDDIDNSVDSQEIEPCMKNKLIQLLRKHSSVFAKSDTNFRRTMLIQHTINTGDADPIRQPPYRLPHSLRQEVNQKINDMLAANIISPSSSPWAAPIVMVKKKSGDWRMCVDYRKLNAVTNKDRFPLPRIDDTIETVSKAVIFSTFDLASGYHQIMVRDSDREKTA